MGAPYLARCWRDVGNAALHPCLPVEQQTSPKSPLFMGVLPTHKRGRALIPTPSIARFLPGGLPSLRCAGLEPVNRIGAQPTGRRYLEGFAQGVPLLRTARRRPRSNDG